MDITDNIERQLNKDTAESSNTVDLKISKKTRDLLKLCKIVMSKNSYDEVILKLIAIYKDRIHGK